MVCFNRVRCFLTDVGVEQSVYELVGCFQKLRETLLLFISLGGALSLEVPTCTKLLVKNVP